MLSGKKSSIPTPQLQHASRDGSDREATGQHRQGDHQSTHLLAVALGHWGTSASGRSRTRARARPVAEPGVAAIISSAQLAFARHFMLNSQVEGQSEPTEQTASGCKPLPIQRLMPCDPVLKIMHDHTLALQEGMFMERLGIASSAALPGHYVRHSEKRNKRTRPTSSRVMSCWRKWIHPTKTSPPPPPPHPSVQPPKHHIHSPVLPVLHTVHSTSHPHLHRDGQHCVAQHEGAQQLRQAGLPLVEAGHSRLRTLKGGFASESPELLSLLAASSNALVTSSDARVTSSDALVTRSDALSF